jgi:homoserine O-succinyltransferase
MNGVDRSAAAGSGSGFGQLLTIGLVNNMSGARAATERQFKRLIAASPIGREVRLLCFCAGGTEASTGYADIESLFVTRLDGIIVTGTEPQSTNLRDEPIWRTIVRLVDWAEDHGTPAIWSCLAAHAAVLYLDGIDRRPLAEKLSGVFTGEIVLAEHPLLAGLAPPWSMPHSRWNGLPESELQSAGYHILVNSGEAGVDVFEKTRRAPFVFFQGHPEYESDTLLREFQRDARRYHLRECLSAPSLPRHYFSPPMKGLADKLLEPSCGNGIQRENAAEALSEWGRTLGPAVWLPTSTVFYRNWLLEVALRAERPALRRWERPGVTNHPRMPVELGLAP